jgi:hypothetical protein
LTSDSMKALGTRLPLQRQLIAQVKRFKPSL